MNQLLPLFYLSLALVNCQGNDTDNLTLHSQEKESLAAGINFWDPIPTSPSTTIPKEIKDGYWRGQFQRVNREVKSTNESHVVFFGDSITLNWSLGAKKGKEIWTKHFARYKPINMGNSGDITPVMLYRVMHGNLDFPKGKHPQVAVLMCGTNNFVVTQSARGKVKWNLGADCPPEDVAQGIRAIAQAFRRRLPETRLIIMGILPVANEKKRSKCRQVNEHLKRIKLDPDEVVFVNLWEKFTTREGSLRQELFTDGTHLTPAGYEIWAESIAPLIRKMNQ